MRTQSNLKIRNEMQKNLTITGYVVNAATGKKTVL
jgi:hypothetical protein